MSGQKNIKCNWDLKSKDKIELKINVKIKFRQILGSTQGILPFHIHKLWQVYNSNIMLGSVLDS